MAKPDSYVQGFLLEDLDIRGSFVRLSTAWQRMAEGRGYGSTVLNILGQTTAVATLIAANLKQAGRLTFQVRGHGPLTMMVVDVDGRLRIRGLAKTEGELPSAPLPELLGDGQVVLTLQTETARNPYQSVVPAFGATVAAMFEHYLVQSEQQPTGLWLAADGDSACGLFLQCLPGAEAKDADGWNRVRILADTVKEAELLNLSAEELLMRLFPEDKVRVFAPRDVAHECPRDEEKVAGMLRGLGREEVEAMVGEHDGVLEVKDDICNQTYRYTAEDIAQLFESKGPTLH